MDIVTHALLAWVLARGFFSRGGRGVAAGMVLAASLADLDGISAWLGPRAFLHWHRTYTHSLAGTALVVAIGAIAARRWDNRRPHTDKDAAGSPSDRKAIAAIVLAMVVAVAAHLLMELFQSDGVTLLWPISSRRLALDLLPGIDPWILALLILGIVLPELFLLVGSEIGAREKGPRGRNGARIALALILLLVGTRLVLHTRAMAELDGHVYKGETPRRVGAFADSLSLFRWHGIVETTSLICTVEADVGPSQLFDADAAICQHKPEASAALLEAQKTTSAQEFLRVARFPRASVEKREDGFEVDIREVQNAGESEVRQKVSARISLDPNARVMQEELVWTGALGKK